MEGTVKDGGPAFPTREFVGGHLDTVYRSGMTLRDYFAASALGSMFTLTHVQSFERDDFAGAAEQAYMFADAMLKARENQ